MLSSGISCGERTNGHRTSDGNQDHLMHRITEQAFGRDSLEPGGNDVEHSINLQSESEA